MRDEFVGRSHFHCGSGGTDPWPCHGVDGGKLEHIGEDDDNDEKDL